MKNCYKVLSVGMLMAACSLTNPVKGQSQDSISMNLDNVLTIALSDNPDIQVANRTIEIKKYAKWESIAGLFPTVSVSAAGVKNIKVATMTMSMNGNTIKAKMGRPYNYTLTGTAVLPLVAPQIWESLKISQSTVELTLEQARSSKISTISAVKKAFFQLLLARDSYEVLKSSYDLAEENLSLTRNGYIYYRSLNANNNTWSEWKNMLVSKLNENANEGVSDKFKTVFDDNTKGVIKQLVGLKKY